MSRPDYYGNPSGVTSEVDVVRAIYAAFAARDFEGATALLSPDCELLWDDLVLFADDYRAIPGAVVVMGHVEGRLNGEPVKRTAIWTWKVTDGKATEVKVADVGPAP